jgi:hypothetical protein
MAGTKEDANSFNAYLDHLQAQVYHAHKALTEAGETITAERIKNSFFGQRRKSAYFIRSHQRP